MPFPPRQTKPLTRKEKLGFGNLAFAGARDTVINSVTGLLGHFADHPDDLDRLRADPRLRPVAAEELFRYQSPITHIGRVCPHGADLHGHTVPPDGRVSLNFAAANRDPEVFENADTLDITRAPNPHVAFGSGPHTCLGAARTRALIRGLLEALCDTAASLEILKATPQIETEATYKRVNGFIELQMRVRRLGCFPK